MAKSSSTQLPGSKDMLKELNNTQGRYIPVWMQNPENKKTKTKESNNARRTRNVQQTRKTKEKEKSSK